MAVIKIVPMPGAVGDKGDEGAVGPQGQQGETGLQGAPGADALWSYNGEYNPGAGYAVGDVVTFDGQLWYRKNSNGGNVGDTPSEGLFWDLLAAKGADSVVPTSGTWDTKFAEKSGIVGGVYPSPEINLGYYYTVGDLVFVEFFFAVKQPTNWGPEFEGFSGELPFPVAPSWQENIDPKISRNYFKGRYYAVADGEPTGSPLQEDEVGNIDMTVIAYTSFTTNKGEFALFANDSESINTNAETLKIITADWPVNLRVANNNTVFENPSINIRFSGVYRKA
jgi:hypothetical protein